MTTTVSDLTTRPEPQAKTPAPLALDDAAGIGFARLVRVELRKLVDTRAGRWLLIAIGLITAAIITILFFTGNPEDLTFQNFTLATAVPQGFLLPVLGILAVTSEWSQRTALVTFTLEPRRARVAAAKLVSAVLMGLLAVVLALAIAALANLAGMALRDGAGTWEFGGSVFAGLLLAQTLGLAQGVAFGMLLLNTPAAIVTFFALPTVWSILGGMIESLEPVAKWLDMARTNEPLFEGVTALSGQQWAQLGASAGVWVLLPLAVGVWRVVHREVK